MTKITNILITLSLVLLTACASQKKTATTASSTTASQSTAYTDIKATADWQDIQIPVRVNLEKPMSFSMSGRATMLRDSLINISMRVLGMEVAVINLNSDSLFLVDKFHKYYFAEPLQDILGSHKMSVGQIQDLILGTAVGEPTDLTFNNPGSSEPVHVKYADFVNTAVANIASTIAITAPVTDKEVDATLQWSADKAKWNSGASVRFKSPDKTSYSRIPLADVLRILQAN